MCININSRIRTIAKNNRGQRLWVSQPLITEGPEALSTELHRDDESWDMCWLVLQLL